MKEPLCRAGFEKRCGPTSGVLDAEDGRLMVERLGPPPSKLKRTAEMLSRAAEEMGGMWGLTTGVQLLARALLRVLTPAGHVTVGCNGMLGRARCSGSLFRPSFLRQDRCVH